MNIEEFKQLNSQQIIHYPLALQALWHDYQGNWHSSHKLIDRESAKDCAWVHRAEMLRRTQLIPRPFFEAYLHRVEGDLWNARYWYRRSDKPESKLSLTEERQQITQALLKQIS